MHGLKMLELPNAPDGEKPVPPCAASRGEGVPGCAGPILYWNWGVKCVHFMIAEICYLSVLGTMTSKAGPKSSDGRRRLVMMSCGPGSEQLEVQPSR